MKIATYNVNGIRSATNKGLTSWIESLGPDIMCLQEVKAEKDQADLSWAEQNGYHIYWHSAQKKGYSGVAIMTRHEPLSLETGSGDPSIDAEGRLLRADFRDFSVLSVYIPSGSSGEVRQAYKMEWLDWFMKYVSELRKRVPNLIICGDYNICHQAIDIHNPVSNARSSGFLPEERQWMSDFIASGFTDTFRHMNKDPHHYTWWSFRANARNNNKGWRIDYVMSDQNLESSILSSRIYPDAIHSDHCPMITEFSF